jgi:hypothetical protein
MAMVMYTLQRLSEHARRRACGPIVALGLALVIPGAGRATAGEPARRAPTLAQVSRTLAQDQGAWVVDYRLRHTGGTGVVIAPDEIAVEVEGWVSNSRVPSHAVPRLSTLSIAHGPEFTAVGDVIAAADEAHRCREKLIVMAWAEDQCPCRAAPCGRSKDKDKDQPKDKGKAVGAAHEPASAPGPSGPTAGLPMSLPPGGVVHVRLRLEHQHVLFGDYDPLLGVRAVAITMAGSTVRDLVPLDREHYLAQPRFTWPEPPEERRDPHHSVTGPDSLHLEAHVPGHHYYRYPDRPVRYSTPMRLRFSYLIAAGTEGECRVRVAQYKDTPTSWRMLNDAGFEKCLKVVGRWTRVEHVFTTHAEATTLALDFRIAGDTDVGEMWIDDVSLEPVGCPGHSGP